MRAGTKRIRTTPAQGMAMPAVYQGPSASGMLVHAPLTPMPDMHACTTPAH